MCAVSAGMKFFEARRKRQVAGMLQTAAGEPAIALTHLLKEVESDKQTGLKALVKSLHFSRHAEEMIQQAGLHWTATRLLSAMGLMSIPGAVIGYMVAGPGACVFVALPFGTLPCLFVR